MSPPAKIPRASPQYINPEVLNAYLVGVQSDVSEIKKTMAGLSEAVLGMNKFDVRQVALIEELNRHIAKETEDSNRLSHMEVMMVRAVESMGTVANQGARISAIENVMPGLLELRKWVVGGMIAGIAMLMVAIASMALTPTRGYVAVMQSPVATQRTGDAIPPAVVLSPVAPRSLVGE